MARQDINVGTQANDGTGDPLRTGIIKVNENFTELYTDAPVSNTVTVGNNSVNTFINATAVFIGNSSVNTQINTISISTRNGVFTGDLTVSGNVYFQGETTFSNSINITTTDKQLILANNAANVAASNGSGIVVDSRSSFLYISNIGWQSNVSIVPEANNLSIGNTTSLWNLYANNINAVSGTYNLITAGSIVTGAVETNANINAVSYSIGSNFFANSSGVYHIGVVNSNTLTVANSFSVNTTTVEIYSNTALLANGSIGTGGQVLTSNGSSVYWSTITAGNSASINVDSQYTWTNLHVFTANVHLQGNVNVSGNTSFTNDVFFSNTLSISGNTTFSNTITVYGPATFSGNVVFSNTITANGSVGNAGQVLTTNGSGVYWANASVGGNGTSIALNANTTDTTTYYLPMSNSASGTWANGVVSNNLYYVPSTGTLSATVFNSLSDREKKENIEIITDAIDIINKLNGVRFDWKNNKEPSAGLIAQDVEKVMPELVATDPNTGDKSLNYSGVIAVLVEAVKYLINKG